MQPATPTHTLVPEKGQMSQKQSLPGKCSVETQGDLTMVVTACTLSESEPWAICGMHTILGIHCYTIIQRVDFSLYLTRVQGWACEVGRHFSHF